MSETEHHKGTIKPVASDNSAYEFAANKCGIPYVKEYRNDIMDRFIYDDYYGEYVFINGTVFEVHVTEIDPYDDILNAKKNDDNSYDFEIRYYNGGCSFSEALEQAISKSNNKD